MSNDLVLRKSGLKQITCIVQERQIRLYGHVARLPAEDPAHRIIPCRDPRGWAIPRGHHGSCLRLVESYLKDTGTAGLGVCLGDGQTEVEGVPSQLGPADSLLGRMPPYVNTRRVAAKE